jgi:DNA-binding MarR family transcriptional regulator
MATARATNSPARKPDELRRRFVDDFGQHMARYGVTLTVGRLFTLLLLSDDPLSLDELAAQLAISKSGVSLAGRDLERLGLARRIGTSGSRRVLYEATDNMEPVFESGFARIRSQLDHIRRADPLLARGPAKTRLREMIDLHEFWLRESDGVMERWRRRREAR